MKEPCEVCWAIAWAPIESEEDCEFADHPHEGPHIRCDLCWSQRRHAALLRERAEDRAAIRDVEPMYLGAMLFTEWKEKHAAAIARASGQEGAR